MTTVIASPPSRIVEWERSLLLERLECVKVWNYDDQFFSRYEYHDFGTILGKFGAVGIRGTIGLFCHRERLERRFEMFTARLERSYPRIPKIFLYFPIEKNEKVQALAVRWISGFSFQTSNLVIQVATNKQRSYCFGPQPQDEALFDYTALRPISDGFIKGFYHLSTDNYRFAFWDLGVAISAPYEQVQGLNIRPGERLPCPSIGSPHLDWCFTKAYIGHNATLRFYKDNIADDACLGVLVANLDAKQEFLGQFRLDKYLSEEVKVENCWFRNTELSIDGRLCVLVQTQPDLHNEWSCDRWHRFPVGREVVWWCGPIGSQIRIPYHELGGP